MQIGTFALDELLIWGLPSNDFHPLGAILFSNETYRETMPLILASGLTSIPFSHDSKDYYYDAKDGHVMRANSSLTGLTNSRVFKSEMDRYIKFWNTKFAPLATIGYKVSIYVTSS